MNKTFNIYCDESTHMVHDGHPYMLLGCTSIAYTQIRMAKDAIKDIKKKHGYSDELKWTNVHEATYKVYAEIIHITYIWISRTHAVAISWRGSEK